MPTQNRVSNAQTQNNQSALELYETVNENLRLIDSVTRLIISSYGNADLEAITDAMLIIGRLKDEARHANNALWEIIKGGEL